MKAIVEAQKVSNKKMIREFINELVDERKKLANLDIEVARLRMIISSSDQNLLA